MESKSSTEDFRRRPERHDMKILSIESNTHRYEDDDDQLSHEHDIISCQEFIAWLPSGHLNLVVMSLEHVLRFLLLASPFLRIEHARFSSTGPNDVFRPCLFEPSNFETSSQAIDSSEIPTFTVPNDLPHSLQH